MRGSQGRGCCKEHGLAQGRSQGFQFEEVKIKEFLVHPNWVGVIGILKIALASNYMFPQNTISSQRIKICPY